MIGFIDTLMMMASGLLRQTMGDYCELETSSIGAKSLVAKDGSLMTLVRLGGTRSMLGGAEYQHALNEVTRSMSVIFGSIGHTLQFGFIYDPSRARDEIAVSLDRAKVAAANINMDVGDLLDERRDYLSRYCSSEQALIAIWTHPSVISSAESKRIQAANKREYQKAPPPNTPDAQSFTSEIVEIINRHVSVVESFIMELGNLGIEAVALSPHEAGFALRTMVDPEQTSETWRPVLMGDKIPARIGQKLRSRHDMSSIAYPPLYEQLIPRSGERLDNQIIRIGDRLILPMYIDIMPQDEQPFGALFSRMINADMPWMFNLQLGSEGMKVVSSKAMLTSFIAFASTKNKQINMAVQGLRDYLLRNGTVASIRICVATWVTGQDTPENRDLLKSRGNTLTRALQNWGQCEVSEITGDPMDGFFSAVPGFTSKNIGNPSVGPISEFSQMLPLFRPGSPWTDGAIAFRTPDGKIWPYQPGSSLQTTWINLIFSPPGGGKSVLLNMLNLALCLAPGNRELPYIHIVDIGHSSSGLILLAKEAMPDNMRHLFAHHRLKMDRRYSINQLDLELGMDKPLPLERAAIINFVMALMTPPGETKCYEGMSGLITQVIDDAYKIYSPFEQPKKYSARVDRVVDEAIQTAGIEIDERTSWYEVRDHLFDAGMQHEAMLAQRYAVPILPDLVSISRMPQVVDLFGGITAPTGESMIDVFSRMISESVKSYPILSEPTQFDLGDSRVVSIDLEEVAKGTGPAAQKQTTLMYMLARNMARHFYLNETDVPLFPERYRAYQDKRIRNIRSAKKHLAYDEFHRTQGAGEHQSEAIQQQVIIDMREGRKWDVMVSLLSQTITDFKDEMVNFSTANFILGVGSSQGNVDNIVKTFGLNDTGRQAIMSRLNGPTAKGSNLFAVFNTKQGIYRQLLTTTIGPQELWAYSTTNEDVTIRNALVKRIGIRNARKILAKVYSGGSAKRDVEKRLMQVMNSETQQTTEEGAASVLDEIVSELEAAHLRQHESS